jgi:hypothetical protein
MLQTERHTGVRVEAAVLEVRTCSEPPVFLEFWEKEYTL